MTPQRLVIGLPSFNEAATIGAVTRVLDDAACSLTGLCCLLCNADSASEDGTADVFLRTPTRTPKVSLVTGSATERGKGRNVLAILERASGLDAACVFYDTDLVSITPEWLKTYVAAIIRGYDFVTPSYRRAKHAASVTNTTLYPLVCGILGADIRQPIGGDFGLSSDFIAHVLKSRSGLDPALDLSGFGIDAFLTCSALERDVRICAVHLGTKVHRPKNPAHDLLHIFAEEVLTTFAFILRYAEGPTAQRTIPVLGQAGEGDLPHPGVDCGELSLAATRLYAAQESEITAWLPVDAFPDVHNTLRTSLRPRLSNGLWCDILVEALVAFARARAVESVETRRVSYRRLGSNLYPLYLARLVDLVEETRDLPDDLAEDVFLSYPTALQQRSGHLIRKLTQCLSTAPTLVR